LKNTFAIAIYELNKELSKSAYYTVHLEVGYKSFWKNCSDAMMRCRIESNDGRKIWMSGELVDRTSGRLIATSRALFIDPNVPKRRKKSCLSRSWDRIRLYLRNDRL